MSAIDNKTNDDDLIFHILHANLSFESQNYLKSIGNIVFHQVDNKIFEPYFNNGVCKHVSIPTLYRLILPSLLPELDKILYLDCDIVVQKSLYHLFNEIEDDEDYLAAGVIDFWQNGHYERMKFEKSDSNFYMNAGVVLFNLKQMRKENTQDKLFDYLKANFQTLSFADQDVLNAVLFNRIKQLPIGFNFLTPNFYFKSLEDVTIVHFAGLKPWNIGFYNPYREIYWEYYLKAGADRKLYKKIHFWHGYFMQLVYFLKMYPFFYLKARRRPDFLKILFRRDYTLAQF